MDAPGYRQSAPRAVRTFDWRGKWMPVPRAILLVLMIGGNSSVEYLLNVHWTFHCAPNQACAASSYSLVQWAVGTPDVIEVQRSGAGAPARSGRDKVGIPFIESSARSVSAMPASAPFDAKLTAPPELFLLNVFCLFPFLILLSIPWYRLTATTDGVTTTVRRVTRTLFRREKVTTNSFLADDVLGAGWQDDPLVHARFGKTPEGRTRAYLVVRSQEPVALFDEAQSSAKGIRQLGEDLNRWVQQARGTPT